MSEWVSEWVGEWVGLDSPLLSPSPSPSPGWVIGDMLGCLWVFNTSLLSTLLFLFSVSLRLCCTGHGRYRIVRSFFLFSFLFLPLRKMQNRGSDRGRGREGEGKRGQRFESLFLGLCVIGCHSALLPSRSHHHLQVTGKSTNTPPLGEAPPPPPSPPPSLPSSAVRDNGQENESSTELYIYS